MKIAIVGGTGKEGRGIALRWARAGHQVTLGSRDAARAQEKAAELSSAGTAIAGDDNRAACEAAEVVLITVPYAGHEAVLRELKDALAGKVVIDITVPLAPPKVRQVHLPPGTSAAQEAQAILTESQVVATLHHVSSTHLAEPDHPIDCDVLAVSDHPEALTVALDLLTDLGVQAFDAGPLRNAVALESLTPVLLHLNKCYPGSGAGIRVSGLGRK
ncbi:MAG: NADPH-dependent F420 reductase [Polyangiaceae bacterium]|nr:NADPH-dependent F420 reductase [Polyangiaceae bacterium]MCW5791340.1 NADPH-dependent F420 reductase [Polyangiaceae bacterium]